MLQRDFAQTGLRVSAVGLGCNNFGTRLDRDAALKVVHAALDAGVTLFDTADIYGNRGDSERLLGEALGARRKDVVLVTKFGLPMDGSGRRQGGSRRYARQAIEASLKRLKTDRIDIYWVHHPDGVTPTEELVRGFDDLARAGKILYAGLSNFSAWRLARAVTLAELTRSIPIAAAQFEHSLVHREPETDLFPASHAFGLGVVTWSPLGGGMLTGKYRQGERGRAEGFGGRVFQAENSPQRTHILDTVIATAGELGVSASQVALAWAGTHGAVPILGPRSVEQLADNLGALSVELSAEQLGRLDSVSSLGSATQGRRPTRWAEDVRAGRAVA